MKPWYNVERVRQPGSVILSAWNAGRQAERERAARVAKSNESARMYASANVNRLTGDWSALATSADSEILTSLRLLRARSRQMVRDNAHAKNVIRIVQNNVVGTGIGMQALVTNARGKLIDAINNQIEDAWQRWSNKKICHTAGLMGFADIERIVAAQLVEAGEVLIRKVKQPFGGGRIPFALEVIEADRLMDQWQTARAPNGNAIRMGVEIDTWGRPVAYWLYPTHPGDYQFTSFQPSRFIRVPADEIIHLYIVERWPQTRGVPWFHAVLKRIHDMAGYGEAEIVAARASANIVGFIKAPEPQAGDDVLYKERVIDSEPGTFRQLLPGEDFVGFNPTRPNAALEPFMRYMLREMGAGIGVSYESLSRDYSQSNYSSSRLSLLDDRALWRILQGWLIRNLRTEIHNEWLDAAVLSGEVNIPDYYSNPAKYQRVRFKPRGWSWIDPTKEVQAYRTAVRCGFLTVSDVIADTAGGMDAEDVFKARRQELDMMADLDLVFDTDPAQVNEKGVAQPNAAPAETTVPESQAGGDDIATPSDPDGDEDSDTGSGDDSDNDSIKE
ncbi:phage portal protein, lambda family [mine drainage metagenome]|uniref:Phage portal protein, lambda family n=1 Tax=mine drainage metagenome TaxID=410659 RepID=A0A1J5TG37_9ZZZZ